MVPITAPSRPAPRAAEDDEGCSPVEALDAAVALLASMLPRPELAPEDTAAPSAA